jgi:hypothetical protein
MSFLRIPLNFRLRRTNRRESVPVQTHSNSSVNRQHVSKLWRAHRQSFSPPPNSEESVGEHHSCVCALANPAAARLPIRRLRGTLGSIFVPLPSSGEPIYALLIHFQAPSSSSVNRQLTSKLWRASLQASGSRPNSGELVGELSARLRTLASSSAAHPLSPGPRRVPRRASDLLHKLWRAHRRTYSSLQNSGESF